MKTKQYIGKLCRPSFWLLLATIATSVPNVARAESPDDILIIVNRKLGIDSTTLDEIKNLFLTKRQRWRNGDKAVPINAPRNSVLREDFVKTVLSMTEEEEQIYWYKHKISKGGSAPVEFSNSLKAVFKLKSAVSYIYRAQYKENVAKIILVIPKKK